MGVRPRFTPQNSPSIPSSNASPASSVSAEDDRMESQGVEDNEVHTSTNHDRTTRRQNSDGNETCNSLRGWTAHQSHGQATILFYVPRWIQEDAMDVVIGNDYVIAGIRGQKPIIKARLTGRIDSNSSNWQLEKRTKSKRHRSRSRSRTRTRTRSSDQSSSSSSGEANSTRAGNQGQNPSTQADTGTQGLRISQIKSEDRGRSTVTSQGNSRSISPVQSESSSFELLAHSTDTIGSRPSIINDEQGSPPNSLSQSMNLSEDENQSYNPAQRQPASNSSSYGDGGVRSMDSSISIDNSRTASSGDSGSASRGNDEGMSDDPIRDAKLVTLHLDKREGGIWPCIVSGPVPTEQVISNSSIPPIARLISVQSQGSLNAAISEAIRQQQNSKPHERHPSISSTSDANSDNSEDHDGLSQRRHSGEGTNEENVNQSTLTIDTIASDDSTTVLGSNSVGQREEELYNMDPITLTLMGMQYGRKVTNLPFAGAVGRDGLHAFECYRRAWREAEIPAAIEHIVHDYLPLTQQPNFPSSIRQRWMAALGGPTALAKLYISYAHLHMRSYDYKRPLLALPLSGTTNNPYGGQSFIINELQSAESELQIAGPLQYFMEARKLDANVEISEEDWQEAKQIDDNRGSAWRSNAAAAAAAATFSGPASPTSRSEMMFESDAGSQPSSTTNQDQIGKQGKRRRKVGSRRDRKHRHHHHSTPPSDQGIVFLVVSRAALLSVVVAGGMAVAGWWRRAAAAGAGG